jgi:hypothetical protein
MSWVHAVIDVPERDLAATAQFWSQVTGWPAGAPWPGHPELRSFEPPAGAAYLHLQRIDGPARVHVDVEARAEDETVARALELGARLEAEHERWRTLRSPGGLPFCVLAAGDHEAPQPVTYPDGHRARTVQVSIDSPAAVHDAEVAFWRDLLRGRFVPSPAAEFGGKLHDDAGSPLQLLFQRLDEPCATVRAHLDHGTDDVRAEVRRVLALGADDVGPGRGWHVLRDVAGLPFCVTRNSPEQVRSRDLRDLG